MSIPWVPVFRPTFARGEFEQLWGDVLGHFNPNDGIPELAGPREDGSVVRLSLRGFQRILRIFCLASSRRNLSEGLEIKRKM